MRALGAHHDMHDQNCKMPLIYFISLKVSRGIELALYHGTTVDASLRDTPVVTYTISTLYQFYMYLVYAQFSSDRREHGC